MPVISSLNDLIFSLFICILFVVVSSSADSFESAQETRCLSCIRNVTTILGIDTSKRCETYYCGQYQISYTYWAEAGKPGNNQGLRDYEKCAREKSCAEQTVRAYFKKFKKDCNNDGHIDCLDMAALHKGGPNSCSADWFYKSRYWMAFNKTVCATDKDAGNLRDGLNQLEDQSGIKAIPARILKNQSLTTECLDCICDAVSGCSASVSNCGSGTVCGPFAISQAYWKDGRKPGVSWTSCTRTKECSSVTVKNYMEKYKKDCNGDGIITCEDYAMIHRHGPRACTNRDLQRDHYWNKFSACRANQKPTNDVNLVKVGEMSEDSPTFSATTTTAVFSSVGSVHREQDHQIKSTEVTSKAPVSSNSGRFNYSQSSTYDLVSLVPSTKPEQPTNLRPPMPSIHHVLPSYPSSIPKLTPNRQPSTTSASPLTSSTAHPIPSQPMFSVQSVSATTLLSLPTTRSSYMSTQTEATMVPTTATDNREIDSRDQRNSSPTLAHQPPTQADDADYPTTDFASSMLVSNSGQDRFDKVVNGIFGDPEFTKSYPPAPDVTSGYNKQNEPSTNESVEPTPIASTKVKQKANTSHTRSNSRIPHPAPSPGLLSSSTSLPTPHLNNPKQAQNTEFQQRISAPESQVTATTNYDINQKTSDHSAPSSISGPDSVNMSSLFETGLNESSRISNECLECICDASSNCDTTVQCISKQREKNRCGLYMISWQQFQDSDITLTTLTGSGDESSDEKLYHECATDKVCAEKLIHLYIEKYQKDCNNDGKIDCYDMAAIHRVGPELCNSGKFLSSQYWKDFNICYANERLTTTTTLP